MSPQKAPEIKRAADPDYANRGRNRYPSHQQRSGLPEKKTKNGWDQKISEATTRSQSATKPALEKVNLLIRFGRGFCDQGLLEASLSPVGNPRHGKHNRGKGPFKR